MLNLALKSSRKYSGCLFFIIIFFFTIYEKLCLIAGPGDEDSAEFHYPWALLERDGAY